MLSGILYSCDDKHVRNIAVKTLRELKTQRSEKNVIYSGHKLLSERAVQNGY